MQTMLSRVGTVDNKQNTLNGVMFAKYPKNDVYQYNAITNHRFTQPIPDTGPERTSWNQSLEIARNGITDAIPNGVSYGNRFFRNVPGANPTALEFWDTKPEYDDDISQLPYPKTQK